MRLALALAAGLAASAAMPASGFAAALSLDAKLDLLVAAYPETLAGHDGKVLRFRDGGPDLVIDDGVKRDHAEKLASGDVEDSLSQPYPAGACETRPAVNDDPGRIRSEPLMKRLYGNSAKAVSAGLVDVDWFGETLRVTPRQGVARHLAEVAAELAARPELKPYLAPSAGVFNWRKVKGAPNLSVHSFGAAIDLNTAYADYWVWSGGKPGNVPLYKNKYPMAIIAIFEKHGFIWGGRWYHYDTMHFEYRPELIAISAAEGTGACR